eukprot:1392568-Amorphochlora_amoeboformis.AAC.2
MTPRRWRYSRTDQSIRSDHICLRECPFSQPDLRLPNGLGGVKNGGASKTTRPVRRETTSRRTSTRITKMVSSVGDVCSRRPIFMSKLVLSQASITSLKPGGGTNGGKRKGKKRELVKREGGVRIFEADSQFPSCNPQTE